VSSDPRLSPLAAASPAALDVTLRDGRLCLVAGNTGVEIAGATVGVSIRRDNQLLRWEADRLEAGEDGAAAVWAETGLRIELRCSVAECELRIEATVEHAGAVAVTLEEVAPFVVSHGGTVRVGADASAWAVYRNGYQSWSGTRAYGVEEVDRDPPWRFLRDTLGDVRHPAAGRRGIVRSDLVSAIVDRTSGAALAMGWLDAREFFPAVVVEAPGGAVHRVAAVIDADGRRLEPGARLTLPVLWIATGVDGEALLGSWADACGVSMAARVGARAPGGWCSWYYYFTRVTEADVLRNLEALHQLRPRLPCDYVMIDDGYQHAVGDWLEPNEKFPHGMRWLAQQIRARGFDAGIWMAPFIARPESRLFRERPHWFVRTASGRPRAAVWNPMWSLGRPALALDTTNPEVLDWLQELARTVVHQWGYRILKLDFLFAAALPGERCDAGATRAQALRRGLEAIREGAGDSAFLLGCGCPLGPAVGVVDAMRIGADVAPFWTNWLSRWVLRDRHGVSTKNAVRNILTRAFMHRRLWLNDPDCLMVRAAHTALTRDEVQSLAAAIALTDGMFVLSDDVAALPPERLALVEQVLQLSGGRARVVDLFLRDIPELVRCEHPGGELVGVFNFSDHAADRRVELDHIRAGTVRELWSGTDLSAQDGAVVLPAVPAHGCRLLWLGPSEPEDGAEESGPAASE
jgi:alpha-galactosidase